MKVKVHTQIVSRDRVTSAGLLDILLYLVTFGRKGRLYIIDKVDVKIYSTPPSHINCRCFIKPMLKKEVGSNE